MCASVDRQRKLPPEDQKDLIQAAGVDVNVTDQKFAVTFTCLHTVEMRGVEPLSESS